MNPRACLQKPAQRREIIRVRRLTLVNVVCKAVDVPITVRDPIHGMITLTPEEWQAVDTPVFQRLRQIRQLAMTHLVYPGATHSRFDHSLGVCHVAGRLAEQLGVERHSNEWKLLRFAALLHDIGHGPFSHVSEGVLAERSAVKGGHEEISAFLLRNDESLLEAVGSELAEQAAVLIEHSGPRSFLGDIVSGPTDADKLDYLLRDSYFAGVDFRYDLDRLIDTATVIDRDRAESFLGFDYRGVWAVEALLLARHHMHRAVYGHKTRLATDVMVTRAISIGIEDGAIPADAYTLPSEDRKLKLTNEFVKSYLEQTDASVFDALLRQEDHTKRSWQLADRLIRRDLLRQTAKVALHLKLDDLGTQQYGKIVDKARFEPRRKELEEEIAKALGLDPFLIAIYIDTQSNPTYRGPGTEINPGDIMLEYPDHPPLKFERESEIFAEESRGDEHNFAYLYMPHVEDDKKIETAGRLLWEALEKV